MSSSGTAYVLVFGMKQPKIAPKSMKMAIRKRFLKVFLDLDIVNIPINTY